MLLTMNQQPSSMLELIQGLTGLDLKQLTVELAAAFPRQAMIGISRSGKRTAITPQLVIERVASAYHTTAQAICGANRTLKAVHARQVAMSLLVRSDLIGYSLQETGTALGGRDHTTIIYGIEKVESEDMYKERGYQDVLAILCEMLEVNYEKVKDVAPPRRTRNVGEATD